MIPITDRFKVLNATIAARTALRHVPKDDLKPLKAIQAVEQWLLNPTKDNADLARVAADNAAYNAAAYNASNTAFYAAFYAAYAAYYAANTANAYNAAYGAAIYAAYDAARANDHIAYSDTWVESTRNMIRTTVSKIKATKLKKR